MFFHAEPHGTIPIDIVAYTHRESERESERERESMQHLHAIEKIKLDFIWCRFDTS